MLLPVKVKQIIKRIEKDGWYKFNSRNNLVQFKHPLKLGIITIAGNKSCNSSSKSIENIINRAGLE